MREIWKDVVGFEGMYQVSESGKIYSTPRTDRMGRPQGGTIVTPKTNNRGYWQIRLNKDGITHYRLLHRVVAEAFIPNNRNFPQVNHIDENKSNNHFENLEWCTNLYNRHHGTGIKRMAKNHDYKKLARINGKRVQQCKIDGSVVAIFYSVLEAQRQTGVHEANIRRCCYKQGRTAGGYKWEYLRG